MTGYIKLASLMGAHPEVAIFHRFGSLNAQNLLYLQAELIGLDLKLQRCAKADAESGHPDRTIYDRDWQSLHESLQAPDGNPEQWQTILSIRKTLKEYNEAMLLQSFISSNKSPNRQDLRFLQTWMQNPSMGNVYLLGPDSDTWEKPDLIPLKRRENHSPVSRILSDVLARWYHRLLGHYFRKPDGTPLHANTVQYSQDTLLFLSTLFGTMCASVLPVVSTIVLYSVASMRWRLAIVGIVTALFAAALGIFTNGRIIEIFSATATFAAVQVVFVGTTSNNLPVCP